MKKLFVSFIMFISLFFISACDIKIKDTKHDVTFYMDNTLTEIYYEAEVLSGYKVKMPDDPAKDGYEFSGWYLNDTLFNEDTIIEEDINLYAKWEESSTTPPTEEPEVIEPKCTITYYDGDNVLFTDSVVMFTAPTKPEDPFKTGYKFLGWYYSNLTEEFNFEAIVNCDLAVYSKWEKDATVVVRYNVNFYDGDNLLDTVSVVENSTTKAITSPTKENYEFSGWYLLDETEEFSFATPITEETNLYAKWLAKYNVNFYDGDNLLSSIDVLENNNATKPTNPTKYGHEFKGWYSDISFTNVFDFNSVITSNLSIYAKFEELAKYEINYISNDSIISTDLVYSGYQATKPNNPTYDGYSFAGWYIDKEYSTKFDFTNAITENIDLYAKWISNENVTINVTNYSGYEEGAYLEFDRIDSISLDSYIISYKKSTDSIYTEVDSELIRENDTTVRCDFIGLSKGIYSLKIETTDGISEIIDNVNVTAHDRSGFAHFNQSAGIGAYNNDGTIKDNAIIVYVSEENKNTVTATIGGKEYTGIVKILQAQSNSSYPLIIRIIGTVGAATWNPIEYNNGNDITPSYVKGANGVALSYQNYTQEDIISAGFNTLNTSTYSQLNNLTNRIKYSGGEFDSYYNMCDISKAQNVTVEGVGNDARIFQWGFTWKNCSFIEVRNLTFEDYTEDACSFEGSDTSSTTLSGFSTGNIWFHHNTCLEGVNYWDVCNEQDKHDGDGSVDLKGNKNITIAYNHFIETHKTGLVGGGDSVKTTNVTFHHNYYQNCGSRLPLGRQAVMHMYNNYYYGSTGTNMSIRAGGYAFIENSVFESCNNPVQTVNGDSKIGAVKSYNNEFTSCKNTNNATIVSSRTQSVTNENIYNQSFDTDSSYFYYDDVNQKSDVEIMTELANVRSYVTAEAGVLKGSFVTSMPENNNTENEDKESDEAVEITESTLITFNNLSAGDFSSNLTSNNITLTVKDGKTSTVISCDTTINGTSITKYVEFGGGGNYSQLSIQFQTTKKANITVYYQSTSERYAALYNAEGLIATALTAANTATIASYTFTNIEAQSLAVTSSSARLAFYAILIEYIE